ncbi:fimbrial protein [Salmonella enterica]
MKKICLLLLFLVCGPSYAADDCVINSQPASAWNAQDASFSFSQSTYYIGKDSPPGKVLSNQSVAMPSITGSVTCNNGNQATIHNQASMYPNKSVLTGVYKTSVQGIGIKAVLNPGGNADIWWENQDKTSSWSAFGTQSVTFTLVRTDEPLTTGTIQPGLIVTKTLVNPVTGSVYPFITFTLNTPIVIKATACNVNTPSVSVPLGDVLISRFTGPGTTLASKNFNIQIDCDVNTPVKASLSGIQNAETAVNSVLALTNAGSGSTATGVGVQVVSGGTPISLNSTSLTRLATGSGGLQNITLSARYYQTLSRVTTGEANATATLILTYQ